MNGTQRINALFVGGPHDGEWHECDDYPVIRLPVRPKPILSDFTGDFSKVQHFKIASYKSHILHSGKREFFFYAHDSLTCADAIDALIKNYQPPTPNNL